VFGVWTAAWPLVGRDLDLSYAQIGLLLAVPAFVSAVVDPAIGLAGDSPRRRALIVAGGVLFAVAGAAAALAPGFAVLLAGLVVLYPASTAFVSLAQASLMDFAPHERERNMARWTLAGSAGVVGGPLLLTGAAALALGWRPVLVALAAAALPLAWLARRLPPHAPEERGSLRAAVRALRGREVQRWLGVLTAGGLLLDTLAGFLALYLVDEAGAGPAAAALAIAVWTGAGLVADALLVPLLARVDGVRLLRASAAVVLVLYPAFLLAPGLAPKVVLLAVLGMLNAGWYAVPQARLYAALPGSSGTAIALTSAADAAAATIPLALGALAAAVGIAPALWLLALGPLVVLALLPRAR
jgi:FSR family fosmidomycin resistance protein-like MFS transporter